MLVWAILTVAFLLPIGAAALSPLIQWREPVYILAGFAGVTGMALLLIQPLLAGGYLPGISIFKARKIHRYLGSLLVLLVVVHVGALWITSPPDVIDALLFVSPTPFSPWGVLAMWAVLITAILSLIRNRIRTHIWRMAHKTLGVFIVIGTIIHAYLIDGTMEPLTKIALCLAIGLVTIKLFLDQNRKI